MPVNAKRGVYLPITEITKDVLYNVSAIAINHITARSAHGKVIFTMEFEVNNAELTAADQTSDMIKIKCKGKDDGSGHFTEQFSYWGFKAGSTVDGGEGLKVTLSPNSADPADTVVKASFVFPFVQSKVNGSAGNIG